MSDTSGQKKNWWSLRWIWPKIHDIESAKAATLYGVVAAGFSSAVTAAIATASLVAQKPILGLDAWSYIDAILMGLVAWRVKRFSRAFALGGIALFIVAKIVQIPSPGISNMAFILLLFLINGARGVFAYDRFKPTSVWGEFPHTEQLNQPGAAVPAAAATSSDSATEDKFFEQALTEVESGETVKALWARALAGAEGDAAKSKALYIRSRVDNLKSLATGRPTPLEAKTNAKDPQRSAGEMPRTAAAQSAGESTLATKTSVPKLAFVGIFFAVVAAVFIFGMITDRHAKTPQTTERKPTSSNPSKDVAVNLAAKPGDVFPSAFSTEALAGEWTRQGDDKRSSGTLSISKVSTDGFEFLQMAFWHLNDKAGTIYFDNVEGAARYKGSDAIFQDERGCEVRFRRREHLIIVSARGCLKRPNGNVTFDGEYVRG